MTEWTNFLGRVGVSMLQVGKYVFNADGLSVGFTGIFELPKGRRRLNPRDCGVA